MLFTIAQVDTNDNGMTKTTLEFVFENRITKKEGIKEKTIQQKHQNNQESASRSVFKKTLAMSIAKGR